MNLNLLREIKRVLKYGIVTFSAKRADTKQILLSSQPSIKDIKHFIITICTLSGDFLTRICHVLFSQDIDANEKDNSEEFFIAVKYEADLVIRGYVHCFI